MNCNVRADVDFGRGPVELWCTETGEHKQHMCKVIFHVDTPSSSDKVEVPRSNVFHAGDGVGPGDEVTRQGRSYSVNNPGRFRN